MGEKRDLERRLGADIAVFSLQEQKVDFGDFKEDLISGDALLIPQLTMKDGTIVYRNLAFT